MDMKHNIMFVVLGLCVGFMSCTSDLEPTEITTEVNYEEYAFVFDLKEYRTAIEALDSLESITIPFKVELINSTNHAITRASAPIVGQGTVENLGNQKTLWRYGRGQNLVPKYLCGTNLGQMTISTVYKITLTLEIGDSYTYEGLTGEYSGWDGVNIGNSQERWQGSKTNSTTSKSFYTYCYDIIATMDGTAPPGGHCWVPYNKDQIRIYVKKFIEA